MEEIHRDESRDSRVSMADFLRLSQQSQDSVDSTHEVMHQAVAPKKRGRKRKADIEQGASQQQQQQDEDEREMAVSKLCAIDKDTHQYVCACNGPVKQFPQEVVDECFFDIPPFQWDRIQFMSVLEDISRLQSSEFGSCLWGNKYSSDFSIGGTCSKPFAIYEKLNRFHQLHFETDGPSMMFSVITEGVDIHPGLLDVIRVAHNINVGGKSRCLTSFTIQSQTTLLKYRGDNSSNKAESIRMKVNRAEINSLHHQLKNSIHSFQTESLEQMREDDKFTSDDVDQMLSASHHASTLNYTLVVDNFLDDGDTFVVTKGVLDASIEMRMFRCKREDGTEQIFVTQSVLLRCVSGVDPYSAFLDSMNSMGPKVRKSVWQILNDMVKCLNRGNMLSEDDMKTMMHWITAPSFLCMMVYSWSTDNDLEILSSDIPVATERFGKVVLGSVYRDVQDYVSHIGQKMNQCKIVSKMKQIKILAESKTLFRGLYARRNEDGSFASVVCAPLPPASFSFTLNLNEDWQREGIAVSDVTRNCIFATIFRVICDPRLSPSNAFREEILSVRCSREYIESLKSPEARWACYMMTNVEEQRDEPGMEVKDSYLRTIGKHHNTNRMFSVMMDIALKSQEFTSVVSTANLIIHRIKEQAIGSESPVQSEVVRLIRVLEEDEDMLQTIRAQLHECAQNNSIDFFCIWESSMHILQKLIVELNRVFRLKNTNLNLLYLLLTNVISYNLPREPAWATTIMLVDAACQSELVVQDKGKTKFLGVGGSKRDSAGFNFTQVCFEQVLSAPFALMKQRCPDIVVSQGNFTDGKKKRMGLTLALKNDQRIDPEDTVPLCEYGKLIFVSEDCHTLIQNTGMAKTFLREACSKKSESDGGTKTNENFNKKLLLMEEPRIMLMATNRKENEMGDMFSLAARLRFFESAADDNCVPLKTEDHDDKPRKVIATELVTATSTTSTRFSLVHGMEHILSKPDGRSKDSVDLNHARSRQNALLILLQHLSTAICQLFTLSGFRLYCNEHSCVSRVIQKEMNVTLFRILEPLLSSDVNEEDRFVRKQEGLMYSHAIPIHVQMTLLRNITRQVLVCPNSEEGIHMDSLVRDTIMDLIFSDLSMTCMVSSYVTNVTYDTFMIVMMRSAIRKLEIPTSYSLHLLIRLMDAGSVDAIDSITAQERAALEDLRIWVENRMKFLVLSKDLHTNRPRDFEGAMEEYLNVREHYTSSEGRSNFIADGTLFAEGIKEDEDEESSKNIWSTMQNFLLMIPEVQNAFYSFRLRRELLNPSLLQYLFGNKKLNRGFLDTIFSREGVRFVDLLEALGVSRDLIPIGWKRMNLHSALRDEGNKNSNVFNLVNVGKRSCVLSVNIIAIVLFAPLFDTENLNILHQLQQKHITGKAVEFTIARRIPRSYWPMGSLPVLQVDHLGKWVKVKLPEETQVPFSRRLFPRVNDIEWYGTTPKMKGKVSTIFPFYEEDIAVCGSMVGMAKRMKEGMDITDEPITMSDYLLMISNFADEGPLMLMNMDFDSFNLYPFVVPSGEYVVCNVIDDGEKKADIYLYSVDEDDNTMQKKDFVRVPLGNVHTSLMRMHAYPYPRVCSKRFVYVSGKYRHYYPDLEDNMMVSQFGLLLIDDEKMSLDYAGTYRVQVYDVEHDKEVIIKLFICNLHCVLVGEMQRMILPGNHLPQDDMFLPSTERDGMVYVYNYPAEETSVCLGMSYCKDGVFDENLETMILKVNYRCLMQETCAEETDDLVCEYVGFHQIPFDHHTSA